MLPRDSRCWNGWTGVDTRATYTYNKPRIAINSIRRHPRFNSPREERDNGLLSRVFCCGSGLCRESSGSTRFRERSAPQARGSGDKEYWGKKGQRVGQEKKKQGHLSGEKAEAGTETMTRDERIGRIADWIGPAVLVDDGGAEETRGRVWTGRHGGRM